MNYEGSVCIKAHAKINLFLEVSARRADGYHDIDSIMHKISLHDTVTVSCRIGTGKIELNCSDPYLPAGEKNLAYRAAAAFIAASGIRVDADVRIKKRIPVTAGMAGGSADAAAVLCAMNRICGSLLSEAELISLGGTLGADVPFCISDIPMLCRGIGDIMQPCGALPPCRIIAATGQYEKKSTGAAYAAIDSVEGRTVRTNGMAEALRTGDLGAVCANLYNVFETVNPEAQKLKRLMIESGASGALLSGSGPSVFGLFRENADTSAAVQALLKAGCRVFECTPVPYAG